MASRTRSGMTSNQGRRQVAQYMRMSTEHQRYSIQNQADAIGRYAAAHKMTICRTYADLGRSGLYLEGRPSLQELLREIQSGEAEYEAVLVYDISRWGRFQDTDEGAYYEYMCRRSGVPIIYCEEQFGEEPGPFSAVLKSIKRAMAAEYSRELSTKVFRAHCRLAGMGFRQGAQAGYGFRRLLLDERGEVKAVLQLGQRKSLATDRVTLTHGPRRELQIIRRIYREYVDTKKSMRQISKDLNDSGEKGPWGGRWDPRAVREVLSNEKYVGTMVYNRTSFKLKHRHVVNPADAWLRHEGAFTPIIDRRVFDRAADRLKARRKVLESEPILDMLMNLWARHGLITTKLINRQEHMPCSKVCRQRFGGLATLYAILGYESNRTRAYKLPDKIVRHRILAQPDVVDWLRKRRPEFLSELRELGCRDSPPE